MKLWTSACVLVVLGGLDGVYGGALWPLPHFVVTHGSPQPISPTTFSFDVQNCESTVLSDAVKRYTSIVFNPVPTEASVVERSNAVFSKLTMTVSNCAAPLAFGMDESYNLTTVGSMGILSAETVWGAMRGLERFSQLINRDSQGWTVDSVQISDYPRLQWRGLMIDTARHWLPLETIKIVIDAAAYNMFNVLHIHWVDDQSFPWISTSKPLLSKAGAYTQSHTYSPEDVEEIISYATSRGIRLMHEFDTPGHTASWGMGYPDLLTPCYSNGKPNGQRYAINMVNESSYDFLSSFFGEIAQRSSDQYIFLGGDEVSFTPCIASNPSVQQFMAAHGWGTDYAKLEAYYMSKLLDIVNSSNKSAVVWQEVFDNIGKDLPEDTIVNVWKGHGTDEWRPEASNVTNNGYRAVISAPYYENYISYGATWETEYAVDVRNITNGDPDLVVGMMVALWAEYIDATDIIPRAFPRAAAAGERAWSAANVNSISEATPRIHAHRCRMLSRDIRAEPQTGPGYCVSEWNTTYSPPWST